MLFRVFFSISYVEGLSCEKAKSKREAPTANTSCKFLRTNRPAAYICQAEAASRCQIGKNVPQNTHVFASVCPSGRKCASFDGVVLTL